MHTHTPMRACAQSKHRLECDLVGVCARVCACVLFALRPAAMLLLHAALLKVLQAFFDNFQSDYRVEEAREKRAVRDVEENADVFQLNISALYQLQSSWTSRYVHGRLWTDRFWAGSLHKHGVLLRPSVKLRMLLHLLRLDVRDGEDL